jgi:N-acylneuraminate cytidylyltransferase
VPAAVALIPARAGSERVPGKNIRLLAGHPLLAYTIAAARESGIFEEILVSTDSAEIAEIAQAYGAAVPALRPAELAGSASPDIDWVRHIGAELASAGTRFDVFSILRPTSPFRGAQTIRRAFEQFAGLGDRADSLRAVQRCREHPAKMWVLEGELMQPLLEQPEHVPMHSRQYRSLPPVYVQNSSLEIAWERCLSEHDSISGPRVAPFLSEDPEGFSIDYPDDWERAERMIAAGEAALPAISTPVR